MTKVSNLSYHVGHRTGYIVTGFAYINELFDVGMIINMLMYQTKHHENMYV